MRAVTPRRASLLLLVVTILWGTTFAIVHSASQTFPPVALVALRFSVAAVAMLPVLLRRGVWSVRLVGSGVAMGALLFPGFALQTLGLARTTPARAGFITGLYVVLVPILSRMLGETISRKTIVAVLVSVSGLAILSWGAQLGGGADGGGLQKSAFEAGLPDLEAGDRLVMLCALVYAFHVMAIARWAKGLPAVPLNAIQLATVAVLASATAPLFPGGLPAPSAPMWWVIVYLALICTVVAFTLMMHAQTHTTPTRASLIYSLEALFAAVFSWMWLGEVPSASVWIGGGLMTLAVVIMEWDNRSS
jgi:drug/metabolite transporter (DMT)-like permease